MKSRIYFTLFIFLLLMSACNSSKEIVYFQDLTGEETSTEPSGRTEMRAEPGDKISIIVNTRDPKISSLFNLPVMSQRIGYSQEASLNNSTGVSCYTVNKNGFIDFPVLGEVNVLGLDREEIASKIKNELIARDLVKTPVVTVEFGNHYISILGEVNKPGRYYIDQDKVTIIDAIGMAGDLTIFGKRKTVRVIREENGKKKIYNVDLTNGQKVYSSPVYYLRQHDLVYVEPNDMKARQSTVNGNNVLSTSFWISLASLLTTVSVLIFK